MGLSQRSVHKGVVCIESLIVSHEANTIAPGKGNGGWSKALSIIGTDFYQQQHDDIHIDYAAMMQLAMNYGAHVIPAEAISALCIYNS